jgi:hypothetical protein
MFKEGNEMKKTNSWIYVHLMALACTFLLAAPVYGANLGNINLDLGISLGEAIYSGCGTYTTTDPDPTPLTIAAVSAAGGNWTVTTRDVGGGDWEFCVEGRNLALQNLVAGAMNVLVAEIETVGATDRIGGLLDVPYMIFAAGVPNPLPHAPTPFPLGKGAIVDIIDVYFENTGGAAGSGGFDPIAVQITGGATFQGCDTNDIATNAAVQLSGHLIPTVTGTWSNTITPNNIPAGTTSVQICPQVVSPDLTGVSAGDKIAELYVIARLIGPDPPGDAMLLTSSSTDGDVQNPGEGAYFYNTNDVIAVAAVPDSNAEFEGWQGTAVDGGYVTDPASATTTVVIGTDLTLQATFKQIPNTSVQNGGGSGGGCFIGALE